VNAKQVNKQIKNTLLYRIYQREFEEENRFIFDLEKPIDCVLHTNNCCAFLTIINSKKGGNLKRVRRGQAAPFIVGWAVR